MIFWIVTAIIIATWVVVVIYSWTYDWAEGVLAFFVGGPIAGLIWAIVAVFGVSGMGQAFAGDTVQSDTKTDLQALNVGQETNGRFFLGSGYVNSEAVFSYITKNQDGGFELKQIDADKSVVYEFDPEDDKIPYLRVIAYERVNPDWVSPLNPMSTWAPPTYEFYVPAGSVLTGNYSVQP